MFKKKQQEAEPKKKKWQLDLEGELQQDPQEAAARVQELLAKQAATFVAKPADTEAAAGGSQADGGWNPFSSGNPIVFMDIEAGGKKMGTIQFELFMKDCPKTAENFRQLCTGEAGKSKATGKPLDYTGLTFHRIIPGFMAQGGDPRGDGSGGESIYGPTFRDENFTYKNKAGYLSMANSGPHTNGSQFFVLFKDQPHLDNKHVVFGRVFRGMDTLREIERFGTRDGAPKEKVKSERGRSSGKGERRASSRSRSRDGRRRSRSRSRDRDRGAPPERRGGGVSLGHIEARIAEAEKRTKQLEEEAALLEGENRGLFHEAEIVEVQLTDVMLALDRSLGEARSASERDAARSLERRVREKLSKALASIKERAQGK